MEIGGDNGRVQSLDIVKINPILDHWNKTAELAVELAASLLGQRILQQTLQRFNQNIQARWFN
jgi:arginase